MFQSLTISMPLKLEFTHLNQPSQQTMLQLKSLHNQLELLTQPKISIKNRILKQKLLTALKTSFKKNWKERRLEKMP
jgi:hypothetical protein